MNDQTEKPRVPDTTEPSPPEDLPTKYLPDATEDEAARQGWWAYGYGRDVESNPYSIHTKVGLAWNESWWQARVDDGG